MESVVVGVTYVLCIITAVFVSDCISRKLTVDRLTLYPGYT